MPRCLIASRLVVSLRGGSNVLVGMSAAAAAGTKAVPFAVRCTIF